MLSIIASQEDANTRKIAITGHSTSFNVVITSVVGGTAEAIIEADTLGVTISQVAKRYAAELLRSASDIEMIASKLQERDRQLSNQIGSVM